MKSTFYIFAFFFLIQGVFLAYDDSSDSEEGYNGKGGHGGGGGGGGNKGNSVCGGQGWKPFKRMKGTRCLKFFPSKAITQPAAEILCGNQGGTLAGLENRDEALWLYYQALPHRPDPKNSDLVYDIWVGGARKTECRVLPYAKSCYPQSMNAMYWTDPSVTGFGAFSGPWMLGNPDNWFANQFCLWMTVQPEDYAENPYTTARGSLADSPCEGQGNAIFGYACSKEPVLRG